MRKETYIFFPRFFFNPPSLCPIYKCRHVGTHCVCVFSPFILDIKFVGRTSRGEERHTGFFIHLLSAVRAIILLASRIQPFFFLVDREVGFCVLTTLIVLHLLGIFISVFLFLSEKNPVCRGRTHVPTCQKVTRYL